MTTYYCDPGAGSNTSPYDTWAKAATDLQTLADLAGAGDTIYCRGTQTLTAAIDFDTNSGSLASGFIKVIGCAADGTVDGTRFVLNGAATAANCIKATQYYVWFENIEMTDATGHGFVEGASEPENLVFINCISHDHGGAGWDMYHANGSTLVRCQAYSNASDGILECDYQVMVLFCVCKDNGGNGISSDPYVGLTHSGNSIIGCVAHNNSGAGIKSRSLGCLLLNNVADENDDEGIAVEDSLTLIFANRVTDNGKDATGYGVSVSSGNRAIYGWNFFDSNADGATDGNLDAIPYDADIDTNETSGTEGYTDGANDDFNLTESATLRSQAIELD